MDEHAGLVRRGLIPLSYARFTGRRYKKYYRGPRFEPSEVYVFGTYKSRDSEELVLECCACRIVPQDGWYGSFYTQSRWEMLRHLRRHRRRGHRVPRHAVSRLLREIRREGDDYS